MVLPPTRAKLRGAVKTVNAVLASLRLEEHPDMTFIGRFAKGFDFLGYRFGARALQLAEAIVAHFLKHAAQASRAKARA